MSDTKRTRRKSAGRRSGERKGAKSRDIVQEILDTAAKALFNTAGETSKKTWLVHMYQETPREMPLTRAKKLLDKHGGSHSWVGSVCHVYILPKVVIHTEQRSHSSKESR